MNKFTSDINPKNYHGWALEMGADKKEERLKEYQLQRLTVGFDDSEIFDLDFTIIKFALPRIKRLLEIETECFKNATKDEEETQYFQDLEQIVSDLENYKSETTDLTLFFNYFKKLWY